MMCGLSRQEATVNYPRFIDLDNMFMSNPTGTTKSHHSYLTILKQYAWLYDNLLHKNKHTRGDQDQGQITTISRSQEATINKTLKHMNKLAAAITHIHKNYDSREQLNAFKHRVSYFPPHGKTDALYAIEDPFFYEHIMKAFKNDGKAAHMFIDNFEFIHISQDQKKNKEPKKKGKKGKQVVKKEDTHSDEGSKNEEDHVAWKQSPLAIPFLVCEYKKDKHESARVAQNQRLMYCVSTVRFLAAMGIKDFPIFGLATHGPHGTICAAWVSEKDDVCAF